MDVINFSGLRLLRLFKLAKSISTLRGVVEALMASVGSVSSVMAIFLLFNYIMGVAGMMFFHRNDIARFGTLNKSFMTMWIVETFDQWDQYMYTAIYGCNAFGYDATIYDPENTTRKIVYGTQSYPCDEAFAYGWGAAGYFIVLVIIGGLILPTLLIGVISISFSKSTHAIEEENSRRIKLSRVRAKITQWEENEGRKILSKSQSRYMSVVFSMIDVNSTGELPQTQVLPVIEYVSNTLLKGGLHKKNIRIMYDIMDVDADSTIDWCEFVWFIANVKHKLGKGGMANMQRAESVKDFKTIGQSPVNGGQVIRRLDKLLFQIDERTKKLKADRDELINTKKVVSRKSALGEADGSLDIFLTDLQSSFDQGDGYFSNKLFCGGGDNASDAGSIGDLSDAGDLSESDVSENGSVASIGSIGSMGSPLSGDGYEMVEPRSPLH
uniref:EF-hand domain-containing protein n=2 Tax=Octactis speculum TaxID=3111310 RepID=A0A7S2HJ24_9STRA